MDFALSPIEPSEDGDVDEIASERFVHFKIKFDQAADYKKMAAGFFSDQHPYLVIVEHLNMANTHVHFQGTSVLTDRAVKARLTRIAKTHPLRKFNPKCRPCSMSCRPVDVVGFQYMCKEYKPAHVLASHMFTEQELQDLKEKSVMHVQAIKTKVTDEIAGWTQKRVMQIQASSGRDLLYQVAKGLLWLQGKGKFELPNYNAHHTKTSIIRGILANPYFSEALKAELLVL